MGIGWNVMCIAASAIVHDLTLVTHNTREFSRIPNPRLEDWELPYHVFRNTLRFWDLSRFRAKPC